MKKEILTFTILKEDVGYSAHAEVDENFIATQGDTYDELKHNVIEATNLALEESGNTYTIEDVRFSYDVASFFDFFKVINAKVLSNRIGMNHTLLAQYISGHKKPSPKQMQKIITGVHSI